MTSPSTEPLRVVLAGAGGMGQAWLQTLHERPGIDVVGVIDLDTQRAAEVVAELGLAVPVGADLDQVPAAEVLVNATVPQAHLPVSLAALQRGLHVLCEKPAAASVAEAMVMAAAAHSAQRLLMISQSRRYGAGVESFRAASTEAFPDGPGLLVTEFFRAPHFGGFREEMDHVLVVDMAIHAFDTARFLLGRDPVSVFCDESNQAWSWFQDGASATAIFAFEGATRYVFTGSWVAAGADTSWNGRWRAVGAGGTVSWDGDNDPVVVLESSAVADSAASPGPAAGTSERTPHDGPPSADAPPEAPQTADRSEPGAGGEGIAGALSAFQHALRTGTTPLGEIGENIGSLAMVEAAIRSAQAGSRVLIADVLDEARNEAAILSREHGLSDAWQRWSATDAGGHRSRPAAPHS